MARFKNIQELFLTASARWSDRVAFRQVVDGRVREYIYGDLAKLTFIAAQALWQRGLRPGDYLAICADNSPEWVLACIAGWRLGAVIVPLDARSRANEIMPVIDKVDPKLVILGEKQFIQHSQRIPAARAQLLAGLFDNQPGAQLPHLPSPDRKDPALLVFTSGTAGASKGVVLSHGNILSNVVAVANQFSVTAEDRFLSILPLSHMFEFTGGLLGPIYKGASIVYSQLKGPKHLQELLKFEHISVLLGTPLIFETLHEEIEAKFEQLPRSEQLKIALARRIVAQKPQLGSLLLPQVHAELGGNIKFWLAGGAPTSPSLVDSLRSLGIILLTGYGLTEASPIVSASTRDERKSKSVGKPLPGVEVKINNPSKEGTGEILVKGPNVMQGYWRNEEDTSKVLAGSWLHTGDCGYVDNDGYLYVTGRAKSVIVTAGGYNIYPEELEGILLTSPLIKEVCVFGKVGPRGEEACALIVPHESVTHGADRDERIKLELASLFSESASYKRLAAYQIYESPLPRTPSGKVQRSDIIRIFEEAQGKKKKTTKSPADSSMQLDEDGQKVCSLIAQVMDPAILKAILPSGSHAFGPEMSLSEELGLDSFSRLELACRLEQEFSVTVPEGIIQEAQTVKDVIVQIKYLKQYGSRLPASTEEEVEPKPASALPAEWKPWPICYIDPSNWPLRDDELTVSMRKALDVALVASLKIYNSFETHGTDRLLLDPPYIVAANHSSHLDTLALLASFPQHLLPIVHPVAAADYFFSDELRSALSTYLLNAVPFDRWGGFQQSLKNCEQLLRKGHVLLIFPEGTRSLDGKLATFKPGVARLSITVGCPIIPAYIEGASTALPKGSLLPKATPLKVTFGVPLYPPLAQPDVSTCQQFTRQLHGAVAALSEVVDASVQQVSIYPAEPEE
jgi:long-chain acyl-CoA synthetase